MILELKDVRISYGNVEVVKGISLEIEESSIVTLLGANGAGKSTILKGISGLLHPASGEIWFEGGRIDTFPCTTIVKLGIGHIPEGRQLFPLLSVLDNLRMGAFTRRDKKGISQDLEEVFEVFSILKERRSQHAGSLSGGEQQMLAMGRALMSGPKMLLMDEPSLGLSPIFVKLIGKTISDISRKRGMAVLLVEQNARMALTVAEKGYVLQTGRFALQGTAKDLANDETIVKAYLGGGL